MGIFDFFKGTPPTLVGEAFGDVTAMLEAGRDMFAAATAHLLDNEILDTDLGALDDAIKQREQRVRRLVLEHLTVDPNRELVLSLKLISIVHEAERIGDLAQGLRRVAAMAHKPRLGRHVEPLRALRGRILEMFDRTLKGFVAGDEAAARRLIRFHEETKGGLTAFLAELADADDLSTNEGVVYAMGARMMSRVSSHLANIASTVACPFDQIRSSPTWPEEETTAF